MYIRQKLFQIMRRINYLAHREYPSNTEYGKGYLDALHMVKVAIRFEMKNFIQVSVRKKDSGVSSHKDTEKADIQSLLHLIDAQESTLNNQAAHIRSLTDSLEKQVTISNGKVKNICRIISAMTGQPYTYVKTTFSEYLEGGKKLNPSDFE